MTPPREATSRTKVFGIGLSKTGTTSLAAALTLLGYRCLHYPPLPQLHALLETHDAATDTSVACMFEELDAAYPGSRFILTTREASSWLRSAEREFKGRAVAEPWKKEVRRRLYGAEEWDSAMFLAAYHEHTRRVMRHFAGRSDLAVLDIAAGADWQPLCAFLGEPVPAEPFPWENRYELRAR